MTQDSKDDVEQLAPGLEFRRHPDGFILELIAKNTSRETVDAWVAKIKAEVESRPDGSVLFWLQDLSGCDTISVPPYMREKMRAMTEELNQKFPKTTGMNALILPYSFIVQVARLFIFSLPTRNKGERKIFFKREEGLSWLRKKVEAYHN